MKVKLCKDCGERMQVDVDPDDEIVTCVECGGDLIDDDDRLAKSQERCLKQQKLVFAKHTDLWCDKCNHRWDVLTPATYHGEMREFNWGGKAKITVLDKFYMCDACGHELNAKGYDPLEEVKNIYESGRRS